MSTSPCGTMDVTVAATICTRSVRGKPRTKHSTTYKPHTATAVAVRIWMSRLMLRWTGLAPYWYWRATYVVWWTNAAPPTRSAR